MKTILVPTDFSLAANNALRYAIAIAEQQKARLILVHAYQIDPVYSYRAFPGYIIEMETNHARQLSDSRLSDACEEIVGKHHITCDYQSIWGHPGECVRQAIRELKPDLVVMGTKGAKNFSKKLFGSMTANTIGRTNARVLAIPDGAVYQGFYHIALATDLLQSDTRLLNKIGELLTLFPSELDIIRITGRSELQTTQRALERLQQKADSKWKGQRLHFRLKVADDAAAELLRMTGSRHYELVVMITEKRSLLISIFDPSLTRHIANFIKTPLLAMR